jgi:hypothetical protein
MSKILDWFKGFWKKHVIDDFPDCYHPKCFDCKKTNCHINCKYYF